MEHSDRAGALAVRNSIEDFIDLRWRSDRNLNWMTAFQAVELQGAAIVTGDEMGPDIEFWQTVIDAQVLNPRSEAFVQPQVCPPFHGYNVAEPLMGQLVADHNRYCLLGDQRRVFRVA